ncbi:S8 family serine peptidase [Microcoleus sp. Pol7_A1]|uniref:S8 family serine peptidase n=1 Tax=Microcoleus sp. Pol7_A1 TaxID=2818893 RepID=UPI002FD4B197
MSNIQIGSLTDNYLNIGFAGKNSPTDTYFFSLTNMGSTRISAEGFSGDLNMEVRDIEGKIIKSIVTSSTNIGTLSIDNLGPADYTLNVSPVSADTNYQVSLTPKGKIDPLTGMNIEYGYFITDQNGKVGFEFLHDGGLYQGEIAIFSLDGMENFIPGSQEFIKEAARRALTDKELGHIVISDATEGANPEFSGDLGEEDYNKGQYQGVKNFTMTPGKAFAVMLVPNGTVEEVFNNFGITGPKRPLFSLSSSNPNGAFLYGQIADITGDGKAFAIEDQRADSNSDKDYDYNDVIFNVTGATGKAVWVKDVIAPAKNWTDTETGKKLIEYVNKSTLPTPTPTPTPTPELTPTPTPTPTPELTPTPTPTPTPELTPTPTPTPELTPTPTPTPELTPTPTPTPELTPTPTPTPRPELTPTPTPTPELTPTPTPTPEITPTPTPTPEITPTPTLELTPTPTPTPTPELTPTPTPTPPLPVNKSPENLQISVPTTVKPNEVIKLTNGQIFDENGTGDLAKVEFWVQKEGGEWTKVGDLTNFTPDSKDNRLAKFDAELKGLEAGKYQVKAIAYDKSGEASNEMISSLLVNTAPTDLAFRILPLYTTDEKISFEYARVIDAEGVSDIDKVDFWLQKEGGQKIEITNDVTEFESDSKGRGRFNFRDDLSSLTPGRYQLSGMAYDKSGAASPLTTEKFALITDPGEILSDNVRLAIAGSANLEKYDPEALAQTREWLIWLTPGTSSQQLANSLGAIDSGAAGHIPNTYRWQFPENAEPLEVEQSLLSLSGVEFAYPLVPHQPKLLSEPKDEPLVKDRTQWHLQTSVNPNATVKEAWELAQGEGVVIGIVDDDLFESPHKELTDNFRADLSSDFNQDADPSPTYQRTVIPLPQYLSSKSNIKDSNSTYFRVKVPLTGVVTDVNVQLGIEHPKIHDLDGYLVSPEEPMFDPLIFLSSSRNRSPRPGDPGSTPPEVELFKNIQKGGSNFTRTVFDDEATTPITTAFAPFTGSFQPQEPLAGVNNQWAPGSWQLRIEDEVSLNTGKLTQLGLDFTTYNPHATSVAGVAVANGSNGYHGSGVAPKASFAGLRLVADQFNDSALANVFYDHSSKNRNQSIDIYNNSWKDEAWLSYFGQGVDAMADGVKYGRGGLGNIYVFGGGNDALDGGNVNYNGLANSRYAIAVGAIDNRGYKSVYSEPGASLLVSAYSSGNGIGITTADMEGTRGYSEEDYTSGFGGTSAAAPFVSGVVALMLEKNPSLSWRDIQYILVETAQKNDPNDAGWQKNGAGYSVNHKYGFGAVNPVEAVKKAADWTPVAQEVKVPPSDSLKNVMDTIPDDNGEPGLSSTIKINEDINVEKVEVVFDVNHKDWRDLTVKLKSPNGTDSVLVKSISEEMNANTIIPESSIPWVFTSNRHWGESSKGEWTLEVIDDNGNQIEGYWNSWKLNVYGAKPTLSIEATDANASESGDPGTVAITRRGNTKYDLKVNYSAGGTASEGIDYQGLSESVTIPAGQSSVAIPIRVIDDNSVEGEETATVTLSTGQDYTIGKDGSATVAITDNDEPPNVVTNTKDNGAGSLRAVLTWANSNPGKDTVIFKIPTTDPGYNSSTNSFTIKPLPLSPLPQITDSVIIDGTTQPGFSDRPVIELDGSNVTVDGLYISAGNSTVRGLTINRFGVDGIRLIGNGGNIVEGNFIGTDVTGTQDLGNGYSGISVWTPNNIIGGKTVKSRNIISGNDNVGIYITESNANNNLIQGNYIGSDVTGTKDLGNTNNGVAILDASNNTIGGTTIEAGNLIFGNGKNGVFINGSGSTGNAILSNSISGNDGLGIGLGANGLTVNDLRDGDTGINNLQNFPELTSAISSGGNTTIKGKINSTPNTNLRVEFFSNQNTDASGYGEGEKFLGFQNVTTDSSGNASVAINLPLAVPLGQFITATTTDPNNNSSEFSKGIAIGTQPNEEPQNVVTNTSDSEPGSLRAVLAWANSNPGKDTVIFKIPTTDPGYNSSTNSFTIKPLSELPHITNSVIIDGTTQPGFLDRPVIELDGSNVGLEDGLYISAGDSTVRGLTINRFGVNAIRLTDKGNNIIEGNFIGTDVTGTKGLPNGYSGISVWTTNNIIGGKTLAARNIISGNLNDGIYIEGQNANNNLIEGNYIGSDITGTKSLPNINSGISFRNAPNNTVGGTNSEAGNLIFGNVRNGIFVTGSGATGNAILSNSIRSNNLQGIDLGNNGLTLNDLGDGDTGANNLQNFPELTSAISSGGNTTIKGKINSTPNTNLRVEFFSNQNTDFSGYGEGEKFLVFQNVTTDSSGNATVAINLPLAVSLGQFITATATDTNNNTSEFSKGIAIGAQPTELFSDINANLEGVYFSSVASGDYDNDGDIDILLTGINGQNSIAKVYQNNNGNFTDINAALQGVFSSSVDAGDYDRDGDLDILLTGLDDNFNLISKVYRNDNGNFTDINANLQGLSDSSATWSDYDNDGDLDILLTGSAFAGGITKIYRNDSGSFTDILANLQGVFDGSVDAGDYDKDGDIDILITGSSGSSPSGISKVYRNDNGNFIDINAALTGVSSSDAAWGDYDNDGDLDILLTGKFNGASPISKIYRNDNGNFIDINAALQGVSDGSVNWGDYDNDGDLDILLSGANQSGFSSKIYRNEGGIFTDISANLQGVYFSSVNWVDYDNDSDLDILLSGNPSGVSSGITKVYRNNSLTFNTVPATPTGLISSVNGNSVTLNWNPATDAETPQTGLTYNLRVGTTPGGSDIMSPMANSNGTRNVVQMGNVNQNTSWQLKNLKPGTYYWSTQAIDTSFEGSTFATEGSFKVGVGAIGNVGITSE